MRALVFDGEVRVEQVPDPIVKPGEALIKVLAAGVCNTDLEIRRGYMQFKGILGHEFVGLVEKAANPALIGKRVVGEINCVCHECAWCRMEMPHHCERRTVLGIAGRSGAFAEYLTLPEENLHLVPANIRDDVAVFTEPLAAAFRIPEQWPITATDRVIVLGDGKLGQLAAQVVSLYTKNLVCVGRHAWKLAMLDACHIPTAIDSDEIEGGADIVVEATGKAAGFERALSLVRPEGAIILKTTVADAVPLPLALPVIHEIKILGSRCGPFRPALDALSMGTVEVRPMISETYGLNDGVYALNRAGDPGVMKVLIYM